MSASKPSPRAGFSLVELLVALFFTAILTTGMLRVFAANVSSFYTQQETLGIQRNSRFALNIVQEEFQQMGYLFPPRSVRDQFTTGSTSAQPPLLIQQTGYKPAWGDVNGNTETLSQVDEIQVVQDLNLEIEGTLDAAVASGATSITATIPYGKTLLDSYLQGGSGNLSLLMLDSQPNHLDLLRVASISGSGPSYTLNLDPLASGLDQYGNETGGGFVNGVFQNSHAKLAPFTFISPMQVVRYTVLPRALDPADPTTKVPCLVRQTAPLVKATIFTPADDTTAPSQDKTWTEQIIAEGVTAFRVDVSLDGGKTFLRYKTDGTTLNAGADSWANFYAVLDTAVKSAVSGSSPLAPYLSYGLSNPNDPIWFHYAPVTIRLDVETRTRMARSEYASSATPNQPAFRARTITMMISPRNFALGSPE